MKVDLGSCAACGAKNSKFVQACYKCGATLPWAPGYVAPKTPEPAKPQPASPQATPPASPSPKPTPQPVSTSNDAKTVVAPPLDVSQFENQKAGVPKSISERAKRQVVIPTWAIGAGVAGSLALGMALMMAFGNRNPETPAIIPVSPTASPSPIVAPTTTTTPDPTLTATPAAAVATPAAGSTPLPAGATGATPLPTGTPVPATAPTVTPTVAPATPVAAASGPTFDALYLNTTSGTTEQKAAYWKTVENTRVSWRGDFVSLGTSPEGPLTIRCKRGTSSALVTISLSTTPPQTLPPMQPNQSIAVEGILTSYSTQGYQLSQGRVS